MAIRYFRPPGRIAAAALLALVLASAAGAGDDRDHDRARRAVEAGEVLPLRTLLDSIERTHPGRVIAVELEREDGRWIYEIRLLQSGGRLTKLKIDAGDGRVLEARQRRPDGRHREEDH